MKKGLLILLGMFMMVSTVEAKNGEKLPNRFRVNYYSYDNAVNFVERGIEFFVFTNGDFDFDTSFARNGVRIRRDFDGRIRRIGNVFINYDFRGNVTRIGNVFINYRRDRLVRVGNLEVRYDRWGHPIFYGDVRDNFYYDGGVRIDLNIGRIFSYDDRFFYRNDFNRNYTRFREDRNYYYYKANKNARIGNDERIIRRRKSISDNGRRANETRRNENFSYRKSNTNKRADRAEVERIEHSRDSNRTFKNDDKRRKLNKDEDKRGKKIDRRRRD